MAHGPRQARKSTPNTSTAALPRRRERSMGRGRIRTDPNFDCVRTRARGQIVPRTIPVACHVPPTVFVLCTSGFGPDDWCLCYSILLGNNLWTDWYDNCVLIICLQCSLLTDFCLCLLGITGDDTLKYQGINSIIALVAQFCTILFIDRTGRRWPLILGNLGNMVTFIIATILLALFPPGISTNTGAQWGFIIMTWLYNFSFSCTCGPLSWIIPSEVFDTRTRSKGVSIATMTSFAFNTMIVSNNNWSGCVGMKF